MAYQNTEVPTLEAISDRLQWDGLSIFVGRNLNAAGLLNPTTDVELVNSGTTGIICLVQKILLATPNSVVTPGTDSAMLLQLRNEQGGDEGTLPIHMMSGSGDFQNGLVWEPQHPLLLPSGWSLVNAQESASGDQPHNVMAFGTRLEEGEARTLGLSTNLFSSTGIHNLIQSGWRNTGTGTEDLAGARPRAAIEIMDILVRIQPDSAPGRLTLVHDNAAGGDPVTVFDWYAPVGAAVTQVIKPRIFLPANRKLTINGDAGTANRSSIILIGRYVPEDLVPKDAYWSHLNATTWSPIGPLGEELNGTYIVPSGGGSLKGGHEPVLEGFTWNGASSGGAGVIANGIIAAEQLNNPLSPLGPDATQLSPTWGLGSVGAGAAHYNSFTMDKINLPVPVLGWDLIFQSQDSGGGTNVIHNACTAWGRMRAGTTLNPTNPDTSKYMGEG